MCCQYMVVNIKEGVKIIPLPFSTRTRINIAQTSGCLPFHAYASLMK